MSERDRLESLVSAYFAEAPEPPHAPGLERRIVAATSSAPRGLGLLAPRVLAVALAVALVAVLGFNVLRQVKTNPEPAPAAPVHSDLSKPCPVAAPPISEPMPTKSQQDSMPPDDFSLPKTPYAVPGWIASHAYADLYRFDSDPGDPCFLVISGSPVSFDSADGGQTWGRIFSVWAVSVTSIRGHRVLVGKNPSSQTYVVSRDDGRTWKSLGLHTEGFEGDDDLVGDVLLSDQQYPVHRILLDEGRTQSFDLPSGAAIGWIYEWSHGGHESILVASGLDGFPGVANKQDDGDFHASRLAPPLPRTGESGLNLTSGRFIAWPGGDSVLLDRGSLGVWRSTDGGETWNPTGGDLRVPGGRGSMIIPVALDVLGAYVDGRPVIYEATDRGPARTTDGGLTWQWLPGFPVGLGDPLPGGNQFLASIPQGSDDYLLATHRSVLLVRGDSGRIVPSFVAATEARPLGGETGRALGLVLLITPFVLAALIVAGLILRFRRSRPAG